MKEFKLAYDHFLIIDDDIYHIGASLKAEFELQLQEEARLNALIAESLARVKIDE